MERSDKGGKGMVVGGVDGMTVPELKISKEKCYLNMSCDVFQLSLFEAGITKA